MWPGITGFALLGFFRLLHKMVRPSVYGSDGWGTLPHPAHKQKNVPVGKVGALFLHHMIPAQAVAAHHIR